MIVTMLPDLLFSVGSSMQEISRDELCLLSSATAAGVCDKDIDALLTAQHHQQHHIHNYNHHQYHQQQQQEQEPGGSITLDHVHNSSGQQHLPKLVLVRTTTPELEPVACVKLEESPASTPDITYPWSVSDIGSNLLRHSDDPLLSGAADDRHNEFSAIPHNHKTTTASCNSTRANGSRGQTTSICRPTMSSAKKSRATAVPATPRARKKSQFKLRFHHQALPQEYLDHYEASQRKQQQQEQQTRPQTPQSCGLPDGGTSLAKGMLMMTTTPSSLDTSESPLDRTNENIRNWLQKISELQNEGISLTPTRDDLLLTATPPPTLPPHVTVATTSTTPSLMRSPKWKSASSLEAVFERPGNKPMSGPPATGTTSTTSSKVVNYKDLPYMGEMTLENSKPRRGRKPKKADICHLIYKNYGTIFPGTPMDLMHDAATASTVPVTQSVGKGTGGKKSDLQNKIITSLLEKRLTIKGVEVAVGAGDGGEVVGVPQRVESEVVVVGAVNAAATVASSVIKFEEPLNLCVRDVTSGLDSVTVSSDDDVDAESVHVRTALPEHLVCTTLGGPDEASTAALMAADHLKMTLPNFQAAAALLDGYDSKLLPETPSTGDVFWPNANVFVHPMALYYQKMADATTGSTLPTKSLPKMLTPKNINQLIKSNNGSPSPPQPTRPDTASSFSSASVTSKSTTNSQQASNSPATATAITPQKRKRSAIFIPPMPAENTTNPATEVSICKFKFTGGAKPSLQEKKMLSVDSGGNFRYYSGTGDKSMRGYEFFPRESLQQSALASGSSAGAFLNAQSEKIASHETTAMNPVPSASTPSPMDLISETTSTSAHSQAAAVPLLLPSVSLHQSSSSSTAFAMSQLLAASAQPPLVTNNITSNTTTTDNGTGTAVTSSIDRRKRKSRRSLQREKLEKTFKEKGFLIQTQQTESAEGATYCKFRQLKKFTRYLFRSWKNYLPGDLQQQQQQQQQQHQTHHPPQQQPQQSSKLKPELGESGVFK